MWVVMTLCAIVLSTLGARPASAHGNGGATPTNYRTTITSIEPALRGLSVRVTNLGDDLELRNETSGDIVVHGYEGEPYLRIGPDGVFANIRSPAYWVNQAKDLSIQAPASADAKAAPEWRKTSSGNSVSWHDHRSHWMSSVASPVVRADPGATHVVIDDWKITLSDGNRDVVVTGDVTWVPGSSAWPWLVLAVACAAVGIACALRRVGANVYLLLFGVLILVDMVHGVGAAMATPGQGVGKAAVVVEDLAPSLIAWALGIYGAIRLGKGALDGAWLGLFAAVVVALLGGVSDLGALSHSQLPNALAVPIARASVAVALGLGVGLAVAMGLVLRRHSGERELFAESEN
jgi:hypothetical protein